MLIMSIIIGVVVVAAFVTALVLFVLFFSKIFGGTTGGWTSLKEHYLTDRAPQGLVLTHQTIQVGAVVYKRCVAVGVADEGLYLNTWRKTVLIPWLDIKGVRTTTLYWQTIPQLVVGDPHVATVAVTNELFEHIKRYAFEQNTNTNSINTNRTGIV